MAERTKYIVHKANIKDDEGIKRKHGEVAELSTSLARRYNKLGFLRPYLDDDLVDEIEDEEEEDEPEVVHTRRRRTAPVQNTSAT